MTTPLYGFKQNTLKYQELSFNKLQLDIKILHSFNNYWTDKKKRNISKTLKGQGKTTEINYE